MGLKEKPISEMTEDELQEKFYHDFKQRFFGLANVSNDSKRYMSPFQALNCCSRDDISGWIDAWGNTYAKPRDLEKINTFIDEQFTNITQNERK